MVLCSGCFDGLHAGHVAYLEAARLYAQPGEELVVAVAPDDYIRRHKQREPRWSAIDRLLTVRSLRMVDRTMLHGLDGVGFLIRHLRPRVFVKAEDWKGRLTEAVREACQDSHTSVLFIPQRPTPHTSEAWT